MKCLFLGCFFTPPLSLFGEKNAASCRNFKAQNDICLRQKVPNFETKIRFTLKVPERKTLRNRKTLKSKICPLAKEETNGMVRIPSRMFCFA